MELTHDDVLEILATIEGSDVEYLELDVAGTRIVIDRSGGHASTRAVTTAPVAPGDSVPVRDATAPPAAEAAPASVPTPPPVAVQPSAGDEDLVTIEAPMVGVFYRAPEPGSAPYIEVGDHVGADDTVGLVEVMKMFNSVTAGTSGVVVEILAENEQFVEYGEPLIRVRPEPAG